MKEFFHTREVSMHEKPQEQEKRWSPKSPSTRRAAVIAGLLTAAGVLVELTRGSNDSSDSATNSSPYDSDSSEDTAKRHLVAVKRVAKSVEQTASLDSDTTTETELKKEYFQDIVTGIGPALELEIENMQATWRDIGYSEEDLNLHKDLCHQYFAEANVQTEDGSLAIDVSIDWRGQSSGFNAAYIEIRADEADMLARNENESNKEKIASGLYLAKPYPSQSQIANNVPFIASFGESGTDIYLASDETAQLLSAGIANHIGMECQRMFNNDRTKRGRQEDATRNE